MKKTVLIFALFCLAAPATQQVRCFGDNVAPRSAGGTCTKVVFGTGLRPFDVFVAPERLSQVRALNIAHRAATAHCKRTFGAGAHREYTLNPGPWAYPGTWHFTGSCK